MDNARVTVWDFTWTRGVPEAMERTTSDAIWVSIAPVAGQAVYWPKGAVRQAAPSSGAAARSIVVALKDSPPSTMENKSAYPNAFPRPGREEGARKRSGHHLGLHVDAGTADADALS